MVEGHDELTLERSVEEPSRPPRTLWGALAALAVLGGTLAVVAVNGDGGGGPRSLPVGLGVSDSTRSEGAMAADMSMAAWITYVAGDGLPGLGGDAAAYEVIADVDEDRVRALAAALGFDGEIGLLGDVPDQLDVPWRVESEVGVLEVYGDGFGTWWFSAGAGSGSTGSSGTGWAPYPGDAEATYAKPPVVEEGVSSQECTVTQSPDGSTLEECVSQGPEVPDDLPSREEAESIALDLLSASGVDVADARVTVEGPYDAWYVMVEPLLDGVPVSGWFSTVGVGSKGAIVSASGTLASAERLDDYPLLDTRAAIDRLNAQSAGFGDAEPMPLPAPEASVPTTSLPCKVQPDGREICEQVGSSAPRCLPEGPACEVPGTAPFDRGECVETAQGNGGDQSVSSSCAGMPCPPAPGSDDAPTCPSPILPEPAPLEVVLTGAERVLVLMPAIDGSAETYLVPGYRFTSDEGHVVDVPAVTDDLLAPSQTTPTALTEPPAPSVTEPDCGAPLGDGSSPNTIAPEACDGVASSDPEIVQLDDGATPELGVPYYVDVDVECAAFKLGGVIWRKVEGDMAGWSLPHEGGRFSLDSETTGSFVGDSEGAKTARFVADHAGDGCIPTPRG